ncbi:MAG: Hpt domain-containing protein, partial [Magnetococcales bacterium]|nr:Hpt domain-containing protein [Magnetococcales bacterium]
GMWDRRRVELGENRMREFIALFPAQLAMRMESVDASWRNRDDVALREEVHTLKGLVGMMGLQALHRLCREVLETMEHQGERRLGLLMSRLQPCCVTSLEALARYASRRGIGPDGATVNGVRSAASSNRPE